MEATDEPTGTFRSSSDPDDAPIRVLLTAVARADSSSRTERWAHHLVSTLLMASGVVVVFVLVFDDGAPTETPHYLSVLFTGLALALAGGLLSWSRVKRQHDFHDWKMREIANQCSKMVQGREARLTKTTPTFAEAASTKPEQR